MFTNSTLKTIFAFILLFTAVLHISQIVIGSQRLNTEFKEIDIGFISIGIIGIFLNIVVPLLVVIWCLKNDYTSIEHTQNRKWLYVQVPLMIGVTLSCAVSIQSINLLMYLYPVTKSAEIISVITIVTSIFIVIGYYGLTFPYVIVAICSKERNLNQYVQIA